MKLRMKKKTEMSKSLGNFFNYQYSSFLVKSLSRKNQNKTVIAVKYLNESLIDL